MFTLYIKHEIRHFYIIVVQKRQRIAHAKLLFCLLNLLIHWPSCCHLVVGYLKISTRWQQECFDINITCTHIVNKKVKSCSQWFLSLCTIEKHVSVIFGGTYKLTLNTDSQNFYQIQLNQIIKIWIKLHHTKIPLYN